MENSNEILDENKQENTENKNIRYPSKVVLTIRLIVGAYVVYLAYQILTSGDEKKAFMYVFVVLFFLIGGFFAIWAIKMLALGEYEGGKRDTYVEVVEEVPIEEKESDDEQLIVEEVVVDDVVKEED